MTIRDACIFAGLLLACEAACSRHGNPANGADGGRSPASTCPAVPGTSPASSPILFGEAELKAAQAAAGSTATIVVRTIADPAANDALAHAQLQIDPRPESFVAFTAPSRETLIVGRDERGAMYGALEMADRLRADGVGALPPIAPIGGAPAVRIRGANLFAVMPASGESCWWFYDSAFWTEYLDLMAHARMNFLDLHGMYNLENTVFPNALLYFATSRTYPDVGIPIAERRQNTAMLNQIVRMAAARGIDVGFMSYRSDLSISENAEKPPLDNASLGIYTREATDDLARTVPGLSRIGFRIGESLHPAAWYTDTFIAGVKAAGGKAGISTRTWVTTKPEILALSQATGGNLLVEGKYNGEQFGPPYVVEGGAAVRASWGASYFYEDYLQEPAPYTFIFQIWASGTHRFFREASYARLQRTARTLTMSPHVAGFTLQPSHAYFQQRDYYHHDPNDRFSAWTFRRDELEYLLLGHLAYDPDAPERFFRATLHARTGTDTLWDAVQAASDIVPWILAGHGCGPDSRDFAPELEWGGSVEFWASRPFGGTVRGPCDPVRTYHGPFDYFSVESPFDAANDVVTGVTGTRMSPLDVARVVLADSARVRAALGAADAPTNSEARDVMRESIALADLGDYFGHKLRGATALAVYQQTGAQDYSTAARAETATADDAWASLSQDTSYVAPFRELLRMSSLGIVPFHWGSELDLVRSGDAAGLDNVDAAVKANPPAFAGVLPSAVDWLARTRSAGPGLVSLTPEPKDPGAPAWVVTASFAHAPSATAAVNILWKPFSSTQDWQSMPATRLDLTTFSANVPGSAGGGALSRSK